jgi:hypothetical protein
VGDERLQRFVGEIRVLFILELFDELDVDALHHPARDLFRYFFLGEVGDHFHLRLGFELQEPEPREVFLLFGAELGLSMVTVAVLLLVALRYSSSVRMTYMCPNFPPVFALSIAAAMVHSSNFSRFMLRMVGF